MKDFHNLQVWKKANHLTLNVYHATSNFPSHERFGLMSQIQRASASIAANLAEGCGRETDGDFRRFVEITSSVSLRGRISLATHSRFETNIRPSLPTAEPRHERG
ncbi:MAG: four helix bundle protein [Pirellulales bacterium]|nr:four helix bundle protein [Pirellulales bacterium]